jgi:hypothetical protein
MTTSPHRHRFLSFGLSFVLLGLIATIPASAQEPRDTAVDLAGDDNVLISAQIVWAAPAW